jgi:DNA-binding MarR family transcriptional regulator
MSEAVDRTELMDRIVDLQSHIGRLLGPERARALLEVDLTIQQLKVVLLLVRMGSMTAGQISRELRVGLSTVTGLVDRLAEQGLVSRGEDPNDRRATRVVPTAAAQAVADRLSSYHRSSMLRVLEHVPTELLVSLANGLEALEQAARTLQDDPASTSPEPATSR